MVSGDVKKLTQAQLCSFPTHKKYYVWGIATKPHSYLRPQHNIKGLEVA